MKSYVATRRYYAWLNFKLLLCHLGRRFRNLFSNPNDQICVNCGSYVNGHFTSHETPGYEHE